jgi:hypothetical protein
MDHRLGIRTHPGRTNSDESEYGDLYWDSLVSESSGTSGVSDPPNDRGTRPTPLSTRGWFHGFDDDDVDDGRG